MLNFPQEFFQEEVREDFTIDVTMKSFWAAEMEVLREISEICERHGLQWYSAYGTLLGAVRHQGFIPWDDDVDIWMLREDYNKFLKVAEAELPKGYVVQSPLLDEGYIEFHTIVLNDKTVSANPERLQRFHGCPFAVGVDIFPLDYLPRNAIERKNIVELMSLMVILVGTVNKEVWSDSDIEDIICGRNAIAEICGVTFEEEIEIENKTKLVSEIYKIVNYLAMSYGEADGDELVMYLTYLRNPQYRFAKELFYDVAVMPYEGLGVPVPIGYDQVLKNIYGDYMVRVRGTSTHDYPLYKKQVEALREAKEDMEDKVNRLEELLAKKRNNSC